MTHTLESALHTAIIKKEEWTASKFSNKEQELC
jgi:hypothetical protein